MLQAEGRNDVLVVGAPPEVTERERRLRDIGAAFSGEAEIQPILDVTGEIRPIEEIGTMAVEPEEVTALVRSVEAAACRPKDRLPPAGPFEVLDNRG